MHITVEWPGTLIQNKTKKKEGRDIYRINLHCLIQHCLGYFFQLERFFFPFQIPYACNLSYIAKDRT